MTQFSHVNAPMRVAGRFLKNRIITGPSTIHSASNGEPYPTEPALRFFEDRARAGAGMVTCAGVSIGGANDDGWHASWDLNTFNHTNRLAELVERIHYYGALASMELMGVFPEGYTVCDGCSIMGGPGGREIPVEKMMEFKDGYALAAKQLKGLGFDGILLHFGHSIPVAQFLSPYTNKRTDQYGGSTENRCRYLVEILQAIRAAVGKDFIIEARISGSEFIEGGIDLEEGIKIGEILQDHVDLLQVSAGMHNPQFMTVTHPCGFLPPMPNVFLAEAFKKSGRIHVPVGTVGAIGTVEDAEEIIASGKADYVIMARSLIADPELIHKGFAGKTEDVTPCIKCMRCHDSCVYGRHLSCAVNPRAGFESNLEHMEKPADKVKKVAVIGGGPAGMNAALEASKRGHEVTLYEKSDSLGGALKFADYVSFKYPLANFKNFLVKQVEKSDITVKLNTEVTPDEVKGYDAVIAAVGATPLVPPIEGIENAKVATSVYGKESELGKSAVVIGGGQIGCETALHLAKNGLKVTVIEMQDNWAPDASTTHRDELVVEFKKAEDDVTILTSAKCSKVTADSVTYVKDGKEETVNADSIILAAGMKPRAAEADAFMGITPEYAIAGDCVRARTVEQAMKESMYAAVNL